MRLVEEMRNMGDKSRSSGVITIFAQSGLYRALAEPGALWSEDLCACVWSVCWLLNLFVAGEHIGMGENIIPCNDSLGAWPFYRLVRAANDASQH